MLIQLGKKLSTIADKILTTADSGYLTIKCLFYSPDDATLKYELLHFDSFMIRQNFVGSYADEIFLNALIPMDTVLSLLKNYQNLRCAITITRVTEGTHLPVTTLPPIQYVYRAIISEAADLYKQFTQNELDPENSPAGRLESLHGRSHPLAFQLIDDKVYELRHKQFNGMLKNATLKDAIHYAANVLGIKNVILKDPTNTRSYASLSFPPMLDISNAFDFLQARYGIYSKGLSYYFTNNTLYVWPGFDLSLESEKVVHIYNVPENSCPSNKGYHYIDNGGNLHILCNHKAESKNLAPSNIENKGNYKIALRTDMVLDQVRTVTGSAGEFNKANSVSCGTTTDRGMTSNAKNAKYEQSSNNIYQMASDMVQNDCELLGSGWSMALPYLILPGTRIFYHYEEGGLYKTKMGQMDAISYSLVQHDRLHEYTYIGTAAFVLRLDPETT